MGSAPLPPRCPSCGGSLVVTRLECPGCGAEVTGAFEPCRVCSLPPDGRELFDIFLLSRGNLRDVQRALGVSYPTARQRMEEVFLLLERPPRGPDPMKVLARLRSGEIDVDTAERLLQEGREG